MKYDQKLKHIKNKIKNKEPLTKEEYQFYIEQCFLEADFLGYQAMNVLQLNERKKQTVYAIAEDLCIYAGNIVCLLSDSENNLGVLNSIEKKLEKARNTFQKLKLNE